MVEAKRVEVTYGACSLILPRVIEMFLSMALTGWFRTDGFSTSLFARRGRGIWDYLFGSRGNGFVISAFLTNPRVKVSQVCFANTNTQNMDVCQVLTFRGNFVSLKTLSIIGASMNFICSFGWALLVAIEGGLVKWYYAQSVPLSKPRVALIMAAIVISLCMDCLHLYLGRFHILYPWIRTKPVPREPVSPTDPLNREGPVSK